MRLHTIVVQSWDSTMYCTISRLCNYSAQSLRVRSNLEIAQILRLHGTYSAKFTVVHLDSFHPSPSTFYSTLFRMYNYHHSIPENITSLLPSVLLRVCTDMDSHSTCSTIHVQILMWLVLTPLTSHVTYRTDTCTNSHVTCFKNTGFYKLRTAARLPHWLLYIRVSYIYMYDTMLHLISTDWWCIWHGYLPLKCDHSKPATSGTILATSTPLTAC